MLADLGLEERRIVQIFQVKEAFVSMVGGLEDSVGASRPTEWLAAGDPDVVEMAHLDDGFALGPTEEKVREAKGYLLLADALDAFALACQGATLALVGPDAAPNEGRELGNLADDEVPGGRLPGPARHGYLDAVGADLSGLLRKQDAVLLQQRIAGLFADRLFLISHNYFNYKILNPLII